jgi:hypothetical protein
MQIKQAPQLIKDNLICKHLAGSYAYGTNIESSDVDYRGIFVGDPINLRTPFYKIEECKDVTEEDTVIYELNQFMKLACDNNPNVVESLWVDKSDVAFSTPAYEYLRELAPKLLCSKIAFTTSGYAFQQLKRIKGHSKWLNNPQPVLPPRQCDFLTIIHNFTSSKMFKLDIKSYVDNHRLVPYSGNTFGIYPMGGYSLYNEETGNLNTEYEGDSHSIGTPLFIIKFNQNEYNTAKDTWSNYWTWKKNRNVKRNLLEESYGYDSKHAMHLVRLLRMGAEALQTGQLLVKRPDAEELLTIRNGAWSYDELIKYAESMDKHIREVLYKNTKLPRQVDLKIAAQAILDIQDMMWNR